jgi:hypothetical protein
MGVCRLRRPVLCPDPSSLYHIPVAVRDVDFFTSVYSSRLQDDRLADAGARLTCIDREEVLSPTTLFGLFSTHRLS